MPVCILHILHHFLIMKANPKKAATLVDAYITHLNEHGTPPVSVFAFCKTHKIKERDFYSQYSSFEALEARFWQDLLQRVIAAVESGVDWKSFSAQQRLLSFLFAFFEEALTHRTLLLLRFETLSPRDKPAFTREFENTYKSFAQALTKSAVENREVADSGRLISLYPEAFYLHLRGLMKFHLQDTSSGYEKTDAVIEKSVTLAFDLLKTSALESAFDLAKILVLIPLSSNSSRYSCQSEAR